MKIKGVVPGHDLPSSNFMKNIPCNQHLRLIRLKHFSLAAAVSGEVLHLHSKENV